MGGPGRDVIHCGPGKDVVYADSSDSVAKDCEIVHGRPLQTPPNGLAAPGPYRGGNVSFRVDVGYAGATPLDPSTTWLVIYEINGVDDAPQVGNFELTGTQIQGTEENVQTASTRSKITLKVTSIEEN